MGTGILRGDSVTGMKITSYKTGILSYPIMKTPKHNVYNLFSEDLEFFCWTCVSVPYVLHIDGR